MSLWHPALRSRRFGHRHLRAGHVVKIGILTLLVPAIVGGLIIVWAAPWYDVNDFDTPWAVVSAAGGLLLLAPLYGIMLVPLGLLLGAWAMRFGVAGWVSALLATSVLPVAIGAVYQWMDPTTEAVGAMAILAPVAMVHAIVMWISTRLIAPEALLEELP